MFENFFQGRDLAEVWAGWAHNELVFVLQILRHLQIKFIENKLQIKVIGTNILSNVGKITNSSLNTFRSYKFCALFYKI